ncbi:MAG: SHOCT domain-containing protein [Ruminococcaceae bacterium]|nr:SHOCT domain-containing protein [Oscillospiraceae bacterium]
MTDSQIDELLGTRDVFYKISQRGEDAENTSDPIGGFKSAIQMFGGLLKYAFWVYIARLIVGIIFTLTTKRSLQIAKEDEDRILKVSGGVYQVMDIISFALFAPWIAYLMLIGRWDQLLSLSGLNYTFNRVFFAVTIVIYAIRVLIFFVLDYYIKRDLMADKELTLEVVKTMPLQKGARINKQISAADTADALLKYKQLLDEGVFTQEEFDQKKRELLSKQEKE